MQKFEKIQKKMKSSSNLVNKGNNKDNYYFSQVLANKFCKDIYKDFTKKKVLDPPLPNLKINIRPNL